MRCPGLSARTCRAKVEHELVHTLNPPLHVCGFLAATAQVIHSISATAERLVLLPHWHFWSSSHFRVLLEEMRMRLKHKPTKRAWVDLRPLGQGVRSQVALRSPTICPGRSGKSCALQAALSKRYSNVSAARACKKKPMLGFGLGAPSAPMRHATRLARALRRAAPTNLSNHNTLVCGWSMTRESSNKLQRQMANAM